MERERLEKLRIETLRNATKNATDLMYLVSNVTNKYGHDLASEISSQTRYIRVGVEVAVVVLVIVIVCLIGYQCVADDSDEPMQGKEPE